MRKKQVYKGREVTATVCYWSLLPMDSSVPSAKALTSSGKRRPCTKLWATRPPTPFSHARMLALAGRGMPSSLNVGCHNCTSLEDEATFVPTWVGGSRIVTPRDGWWEVWTWASPGLVEDRSASRCLLRVRPEGGGGGGWVGGAGTRPLGGCCWTAWFVPRMKWLTVKVLQVTMSPGTECVLEESLDSTTSCSAT